MFKYAVYCNNFFPVHSTFFADQCPICSGNDHSFQWIYNTRCLIIYYFSNQTSHTNVRLSYSYVGSKEHTVHFFLVFIQIYCIFHIKVKYSVMFWVCLSLYLQPLATALPRCIKTESICVYRVSLVIFIVSGMHFGRWIISVVRPFRSRRLVHMHCTLHRRAWKKWNVR